MHCDAQQSQQHTRLYRPERLQPRGGGGGVGQTERAQVEQGRLQGGAEADSVGRVSAGHSGRHAADAHADPIVHKRVAGAVAIRHARAIPRVQPTSEPKVSNTFPP
jgi:hypothetical protein